MTDLTDSESRLDKLEKRQKWYMGMIITLLVAVILQVGYGIISGVTIEASAHPI